MDNNFDLEAYYDKCMNEFEEYEKQYGRNYEYTFNDFLYDSMQADGLDADYFSLELEPMF